NFVQLWYKAAPPGGGTPGEFTVRISSVTLDHLLDVSYLVWLLKGLEGHRVEITPAVEITDLVHPGSGPAGHTGGKVTPRLTEHHHAPTRHILTTMVPHGFYHGPD